MDALQVNHRIGKVIFSFKLPSNIKNKQKKKEIENAIDVAYTYLCHVEGKKFIGDEISIQITSGMEDRDFIRDKISFRGEIIIQNIEKQSISNLMQKINERGSKGTI